MPIYCKRLHKKADTDDGSRIFVEKDWPNDVEEVRADIHEWVDGVAPSKELQKALDDEPKKFESFKEAYKVELEQDKLKREEMHRLKEIVRMQDKDVTLVFSSEDVKRNHAWVLKEILDQQPAHPRE